MYAAFEADLAITAIKNFIKLWSSVFNIYIYTYGWGEKKSMIARVIVIREWRGLLVTLSVVTDTRPHRMKDVGTSPHGSDAFGILMKDVG